MARVRDIYNYTNPRYAGVRDPMRRVVGAYQNANRFLDTVQEWVYIETGMIHTSRMIHNLAHKMPEQFDRVADMLHERHLMVEYPATPELTEEIGTMDRAFEIVIECLNEVQEALERFRAVTDNPELRPMTLMSEEFMAELSGYYTKVLAAWNMWDQGVSPSSFDNWISHLMEEEEEGEDD